MTNEALEARRKYQREWARRNPDKIKRQQERYWQRRAEKAAAESKAEGDRDMAS